jgi:hypothetical protein
MDVKSRSLLTEVVVASPKLVRCYSAHDIVIADPAVADLRLTGTVLATD